MTAKHGIDAIDLLMRDHRLAEQLFLQLDAAFAAGDEAEQRDLAERVVTDLSVHAAVEDAVLYPAARDVADTVGMVDASVAGHDELEAVLADLDGTNARDAGFADAVRRAGDAFARHVADQEGGLFPALRRAVPEEELVALHDRLVEARRTAPTRPRRSAPAAVADAVADAAASLIDKAKDAIRGIGSD